MDELKEKIYDFDETVSIDEIKRGLMPFFDDICSRKRGTLFYDDFRSLILVLPNRCLAKACERRGLASHNHSSVNLIRYANNDFSYFSEEDEKSPFTYFHEKNALRNCLRLRLSASKDKLLLDVEIGDNSNEFQLKVLKIAIKYIKLIKEKDFFQEVEVNIWTYRGRSIYSSKRDEEELIFNDDFDNKIIEISQQSKK